MNYSSTQLKDICQSLSGYAWKSSKFNFERDGIPIIRIQNIGENSSSDYAFWSEEYSNKFLVNKDDLLITLSGSFKVDKWKGGKALLNQRIVKLTPSKGIDKDWLFHNLKNQVRKIERLANHALVSNVSVSDLLKLTINIPPLDEQQRIAEILDTVKKLLDKRFKTIKSIELLKSSIFENIFGNPLVGEKGIFKFQDLAISDKGTFSNGPFGSDLLKSELKSVGVPVIYIKDIRNAKYKKISHSYVSQEKATSLEHCSVLPEDVLIAKVGDPPGTAAIYPANQPKAIVTQDVIRIRPDKNKVLPTFLMNFLNSSQGEKLLKKITVQSTRSRIGLGDLKKLSISIPTLQKQEYFSQLVNLLDIELEYYLKHQEQLKKLSKSLSQKYFS